MKIALIKLSSFGDIVHALIGCQFIKASVNDVEIHWIVEDRFANLLHDHPHIDKLHTVDIKNLSGLVCSFKKITGPLRSENFDKVIDLQGLIKSAVISRLISRSVYGFSFSGAREWAAALFYRFRFRIPYKDNVIRRNLRLLSMSLPFPFTSEQILNKSAYIFFQDRDLVKVSCYRQPAFRYHVVMIPSASSSSRVFPPEMYRKIIKRFEDKEPGKHAFYFSNGSAAEKAAAEEAASGFHNAFVLPKMNLKGLTAFFSLMNVSLGPDTGPSHMMFALNRPSLTLYLEKSRNRASRNSYETEINRTLTFEDGQSYNVEKIIEVLNLVKKNV